MFSSKTGLTRFYLIIFFIQIIFFESCSENKRSDNLIEINGVTMGTIYSVKILKSNAFPRQNSVTMKKMKTDISRILKNINNKMSVFLPSSEISQLNQYPKSDWFEISTSTAWVMKKSLEVSEQSGGAFDITIGPLVDLWGFGSKKVSVIPNAQAIARVLNKTGYHLLKVRLSPPAVKKDIPEVGCTLAAIAKGYGVDRLAEYLNSKKVVNYLIEIGGEVRVKGNNKFGKCWRVGIASPVEELNIQKVVELKNCSLATSGDYRNYFEYDGIRYSHTLNPKTGWPIAHQLASVSVIHESCMLADALATAINVLGPKKGFEFALKEKLSVFLIIRCNDKFIEKMTPLFKKYLLTS